MSRRAQYFHPFDITYGEVSRKIRDYITSLSDPAEAEWLKKIMWNFQTEADLWDYKGELTSYRSSMSDLKLNILRLAAGAFLHISYDLPRVLANNWPGKPPNDPPPLEQGLRLYDYIGTFFSDVMDDILFRSEVVGVVGPALQWPLAKRAMKLWLVNLRNTAWMHAHQLAHYPAAQRAQLEQRMLSKIADALDNTSHWMPWDVLKLSPPDLLNDVPGPVAYSVALPVAAISFFHSNFEFIVTMLNIYVLYFVTINSNRLIRLQGKFRDKEEKDFKLRNEYANADRDVREADSLAAEFISRLGSNIEHNLSELFK
jgi:hypothetical protein